MADLLAKRDQLNQAALPSRRAARRVAAGLLGLLAFGSLVAGYFVWRAHAEQYKERTREHLAGVAQTKAGQVARWREERLADGLVLGSMAPVEVAARAALSGSGGVAQPLHQLLSSLLRNGEYSRAFLLDPAFQVRVAVPNEDFRLAPPFLGEAKRVAEDGKVVLGELQRVGEPDRAAMMLWIPMNLSTGPQPGSSLPMLGLEINPHHSLYPLLQPPSTRSGEVVLVRQDENFVLYLNELRHKPNSAAIWRLPMNQMDLPAARAVRGEMRVQEGADYRKASVLAAPAAVPGSAWFVVAKLESAEAFASLRRTGWMLAGVPAVWVVCLGLGAWLSRGGLRTQLLRQELAGEQERAGLQERIAALLRQSQDIILLTDQHWKILEANERALAAYGHPLARLRQMSLRDLVPAKLRGDFEKQLAGLRPNSGLVIDVQQQRKDGTNFAAKGSFQVVAFAGVRYCQAMLREL